MTNRSSSKFIVLALALSLSVAPAIAQAQATAAPDASSTNASPAAPAPAAPAPATTATPPVAAPADTNAPASTTPEERPTSYTIVKGDSLWSIAHKYGTTVVKLRKLNKLKTGALLHPGQVLQIPPATSSTTTSK